MPCSRSHASSATPRCANGHPRTLHLRPLPQLPQAQRLASRYASYAWTKLRIRAPAALLETSRRRSMTGRGGGNARRADLHVIVTLKATTAATAPEATGASSFGNRGARLQPDAALRREATGTLAKSRISLQYRQSKNSTWIEKRCLNIYTWIYIIIYNNE